MSTDLYWPASEHVASEPVKGCSLGDHWETHFEVLEYERPRSRGGWLHYSEESKYLAIGSGNSECNEVRSSLCVRTGQGQYLSGPQIKHWANRSNRRGTMSYICTSGITYVASSDHTHKCADAQTHTHCEHYYCSSNSGNFCTGNHWIGVQIFMNRESYSDRKLETT